jgi:hypothetical protein
MNEPETGVPEPESGPQPSGPFENQPRTVAVPGRGCSRMALAGCGLTTLVLALGMLVLIMYASDIASWGLNKVRSQIEQSLPGDLPATERERFNQAFDAVIEKVKRGDLDPRGLPDLQAELERFAKRSADPSREDVLKVIKALEAFVGIESPGGSGEEPVETVPEAASGATT